MSEQPNPKIFVANLSWNTSDEEVSTLFAEAGEVLSVHIPVDKATGRQRGFAFVEMSNPEEASKAIELFDQWEFKGRNLAVKLAEARPAASSRSY
jgi:RNA recognition motif-containing protein